MPKRLLVTFIALVALAAMPTRQATATGFGEGATAWDGAGGEARARVIRERMGFDASPDTVSRSISDRVTFPNLDFGIPLTDREAAEILRRNQMALDAERAVETATKDPGWAGAWIDNLAGGVLVFQFTGAASDRAAQLTGLLPEGTPVRFTSVQRTLADLREDRRLLWNDAEAIGRRGAVITGLGIDVVRNRLAVAIQPGPLARQVFLSMYDGDAAVREQDAVTADACPLSDCFSIKGGIGYLDTNDNWPCTVGYMARRTDVSPDRLIGVTAGHCIDFGSKAPYFHHGAAPGGNIGVPDTGGGRYVQTFREHADGTHTTADVGLFTTSQLSASEMSNRDQILYISSSETTADITQVTPWGSQMPGTYVCRYGRSSLRVCGDIILNDDDRISRVRNSAGVILEQHLILGTVVYAADAIGGDSGGPVAVFTKEHDPNAHWMAALYGTHVHSFPETSTIDPNGEGWYSPVTSGIAEMQSQFGVTLAACTTDLCGLP